MNERTARLLELQQVDGELSALIAEQREKPRLVKERRQALDAKSEQLEAFSNEVKHLQTQAMQRELEVQTREEKLNQLRLQLNAIKDNKSYKAMLHEIEDAQLSLSDAEEQVLLAYDETEHAQARAREMASEIRKETAELEAFAREVEQAADELNRSIEDGRGRRGRIADATAADDLHLYERLNRSRPGQAVVAVIAGACRGCFTGLSSNEQSKLLRQEGILTCATCGRVVYLGDDLSADKMNEPEKYNPLG